VKIDAPVAVGLNMPVPGADVETVVVGAGHAGLAASWALAERGVEHVVLEEARIGEVWRSARWSSFRLNTPRWMSRLPGQTVAEADADGFDTAPEFAAVLEEFARLHDLPVRTRSGAVRVEHGGDRRFTVRTRVGDVRARSVVLATGFLRVPARPPLAGALPARLLQLDTATYRSADEVADGAVLVVGGGQSGCQIAEDLATAGRRVLLSTSRVAWVPRRHRGRDTVGWWTVSGFFSMRRADADDALLRQRQPLISGTDGGHSLSLHSLARHGVELLGRLTGGAGEELRFGDDVAEHARFADESSIAGIGRDAPGAVRLDRAGVGTVIWCAGMRPRLDAVSIPGLVDGGAIPHTGGATAVPGLHLLGAPWLRRRKSGIIWGAPADAQEIAAAIANP
jgi:putative flavoprotein involved in K+ transport